MQLEELGQTKSICCKQLLAQRIEFGPKRLDNQVPDIEKIYKPQHGV